MSKQKNLLGTAISIAADAHENQKDRQGMPYILHPLHVMNEVIKKYPEDILAAQVAVLHDVIESSDWTLTHLVEVGFSNAVLDSLYLLTHQVGVDYESYVRGLTEDYRATVVKIEDLRHNSDITRLKGIKEKDIKRIEKYHKAFLFLNDHSEEVNYGKNI
jgi:(p)ppGpp synthase/HD superfamily hydrolase